MVPEYIHIYNNTEGIDSDFLRRYFRKIFPVAVITVYPDFFASHLKTAEKTADRIDDIAGRIAAARIIRPDRYGDNRKPLPGEVSFERRFLFSDHKKPVGIMYDGIRLSAVLGRLISSDTKSLKHCHIMITNQLTGSWESADLRYHARTAVYGFPNIISVKGLVDAPARPREYYLQKQLGLDREPLADKREREFLVSVSDPRITEVLKGYLLQALFCHITGDPFCGNPECRLFNAHWQKDMLHAQLQPGATLCPRHGKMLKRWKKHVC